MEESPNDGVLDASTDLCEVIHSSFSNSTDEDHVSLCFVIGVISQELKDQRQPTTPTSYYLRACSSLQSDIDPLSPSAVGSFLTVLSYALPRLPRRVVRETIDRVSDTVVQTLRRDSVVSTAGVVSGLKCAGYLLSVRDSVNWDDSARLFSTLLGFLTDPRPKVRRQSHGSLRDVLASFQGTSSLLSSASEGIYNSFQRFLLLASGSDKGEEGRDGPSGVWEVLHILEALKECLPLMSMSYKTNVLQKYRLLLEIHQPPVTKRVADSLSAVCLHSGSDVPAEALLDLLCSFALNASSGETSADNLTFTAHLLQCGMRKVYSLNREICMSELPVVFSTLKDILASEHEEAIFASMEALKGLISDCIDQKLIKQGVDQIRESKKMDCRKSGPTVIEKVCATIESLLDYHHSAVWDMIFHVVGAMFNKLGTHSSYFAKETLKNLADIQRLPDEDFPHRKQLHECLGCALAAMGPETFLNVLPLNLDANDLSEVNVWLFPILKQYTVGAPLSFFVETLLSSVSLLRNKSQKLELQGRIIAARSTDALVFSVWSLLPSFCNYPLDTAESFEHLKNALVKALHEQAETRGMICSALNVLIYQNKKILENKSDPTAISTGKAPERALSHCTPKVAEDNLSVLKSSAHELVAVLARIFLESPADDGGCLQSTISEFASIADKKDVEKIFSKIMGRLLTAMKKALATDNYVKHNSMRTDDQSNYISQSAERARLFDLAVSLLPGLNGAAIGVLFSAVKPALEDNEGVVQKKAYKVLAIILQKSDEFLQSTLDQLLQLMIDVMPLCHFSAKRHRLDCLYSLIVQVSKLQEDSKQRQQDIMSSFLTEIILALKEANKKTRNRAYDLLVQIGHACGDEENGGRRENLYNFFNLVAGGLAGDTPHMVSSAVKGLARLAYEFSDLVSTAYKLLPSTYLLLQRKNREIIKACLGLLKVLVAKSHSEELQVHLESMVAGLLKWQADYKNHFKAKVKYILEMLVSKCGLDAVKAVMPEEHMKLLTNIRKIKEQKERKQGASSEETRSRLSRATTSRLSKWNHTRLFSDFGEDTEDNDEFMDAKSGFGRRSRASLLRRSGAASSRRRHRSDRSLPEDLSDQIEDEPLDLLDRQKTRSALRSSGHLKRKQESDEEPEIDPEGRLIVYEGGNPKRNKPDVPESDAKSNAGSHMTVKSTKKTKKQKTSDVGWGYTGSEYGSKKAGGDVKRKDKLEPYAYWPLDRKMISRRPKHQAAARKGMASVVKLTKKLEGRSASSALSMNLKRFKKQKKKGSKTN